MPKKKPSMFTFEHDGKTYSIPSGATKISEIPGQLVRDAYMNGDEGEMILGFTLLEKVDVEPGTVEALYAKPSDEMLATFRAWMRFKPESEDADLGESSASSD